MMLEGFDLITIDVLTTFAGAVLVTNIVTHFVKDYTPTFIDKKIVALLVAMVIMFMNQYILGAITLKNIYVGFLNSFLVATAAMGNYEILTTKTKKRMTNELKLEELKLENQQGSNQTKKVKRNKGY